MIIDVYVSTKNESKFLSVPQDTNLSELTIEDQDYKSVSLSKKGKHINLNENRIGVNTNDVINQINKNGYALHSTKTTFEEGK
jgi:uncharacterized protein YcgL (UPF0745 family)